MRKSPPEVASLARDGRYRPEYRSSDHRYWLGYETVTASTPFALDAVRPRP